MRLTTLSHGGGCGCKIAPHVLETILQKLPKIFPNQPNILVGFETKDDAAVYKINEQQAIIFTTDFFMPIVDDAFDFGRVAATNAISDVYAMGGQPLMALSILGMPVDKLSPEIIGRILEGGSRACVEAGIAIVGGHSIDTPEPIFGLAVVGLIHPKKILKNSQARENDVLILTKPLGIGLYTTCLKKELLAAADYEQVIKVMTTLNRVGESLSNPRFGVHAATDVTGFGLLGHLNELCEAAKLGAVIDFSSVPKFENISQYLKSEFFPGGANRNLAGYGHCVEYSASIYEAEKLLLADPQTSGGLLLAVLPECVNDVLAECKKYGAVHATVIGRLTKKTQKISVEKT